MDFASVVEKVSRGIAKVYRLNSEGKVSGTGSGFLYSKKGILVTCNHVVEGGQQTLVCKFPDAVAAESVPVASTYG
jgi:S1-C subfamily serine protease